MIVLWKCFIHHLIFYLWGWQQTHVPKLCHFPTPIERIYYFETLTFRDSIDTYFKSTSLIFLTNPNVPTKIVNVPTNQAGTNLYNLWVIYSTRPQFFDSIRFFHKENVQFRKNRCTAATDTFFMISPHVSSSLHEQCFRASVHTSGDMRI